MEPNKPGARVVSPKALNAVGPRAPLPEPERDLEIPDKCAELHNRLDILDKESQELAGRLAPVLRVSDPSNKSGETAAGARCEIGGNLQSACDRVYTITSLVRGILSTLEL